MGSPLSPAVANIFMSKLEERALSTFADPPTTWFRFVDDVFSIVRKRDAGTFLDHLNTQHPSIRFTMEEEEEQKLPYLDLNVNRCQGGSLRTSIYRKRTHTSSYLKFESNHPPSAKRSVISSLIKRMDNITLGEDEKRKEERLVISELEANGYPLAEIKRVQRRLKKEGAAKAIPKPKQDDDITAIAAIPYVPGISEAVSRILPRCGSRPLWELNNGNGR